MHNKFKTGDWVLRHTRERGGHWACRHPGTEHLPKRVEAAFDNGKLMIGGQDDYLDCYFALAKTPITEKINWESYL